MNINYNVVELPRVGKIRRNSCGNITIFDYIYRQMNPPSSSCKCRNVGVCLNYHVEASYSMNFGLTLRG